MESLLLRTGRANCVSNMQQAGYDGANARDLGLLNTVDPLLSRER
eukprot:COSAG01_NODE_26642_length_707_cov_1.947368_1_plen_44_part_01